MTEVTGSASSAVDCASVLPAPPLELSEGFQVLEQVIEGVRRYLTDHQPVIFALEALPPGTRVELLDRLGEGEVKVTVAGTRPIEVRETGLPGLWRVQEMGEGGAAHAEYLEIADVPSVVRAANANATCGDLSIGDPPAGAMNVLPVLAELRHRMKSWVAGQPNHIISFTLLPMNDVDMRYLETRVGHGPVEAESLGYGRCRVELTGHRHIWSVQFFNVSGKLVLDTLEVGDVPTALVATDEDLQDSARQLEEVLSA